MEQYKSGFIAIVGRPNVGKSTLVNSLIGQKIAIMSDKPQTTRNKIMCVLTEPTAQLVFIDTPGIHKPRHKLGEKMVSKAVSTLQEVDAVLFVVDVSEKPGMGDQFIIDLLKNVSKPVVLAINKIDKVPKDDILPRIAVYTEKFKFSAIVPISALIKDNLQTLVTQLTHYLPEGPQYFPGDMVTDQPERLIVAELIRERLLHLTRDEIPHSIAVDIEEIKTRENGVMYVRAMVYVEQESQKRIVIGAKGQLLKQVGQEARGEIENLLGNPVYLDLWVKVKKDWRNRENMLKQLGVDQ